MYGEVVRPADTPAVFVPALLTPQASFGTWSLSQQSGHFFGGVIVNTGGDGRWIEWDVYLAAGVYTLDIFFQKNSDAAITDVLLDGTEVASFDGYAASSTPTRSTETGIVVPTPGTHTVRLIGDGQNASSSGFFQRFNAFAFTRTA